MLDFQTIAVLLCAQRQACALLRTLFGRLSPFANSLFLVRSCGETLVKAVLWPHQVKDAGPNACSTVVQFTLI